MLAHTGHLATPSTQVCLHRLHCKPVLGTDYCQFAVSVLLQEPGQRATNARHAFPPTVGWRSNEDSFHSL